MSIKLLRKAAEFEFQTTQSLTEDEKQSLIATLQRLSAPNSPLNPDAIGALVRRLQDEPQIANQVPNELAALIQSAEAHIQAVKPYLQNKGLLDNREKTRGNYPMISKKVQEKLNQLGAPHVEVDGSLGPATKAALDWYRNSRKLRSNMSDDEVMRLIMQA